MKNESNLKPCTSNGKESANDENLNRNTIRNQSSTDSESDGVKPKTAKTPRLRKGESILSGMWHNLSDEAAYTHFFKQLLELEYPSGHASAEHYNSFEIVPFKTQLHNDKPCKSKNSQNHKKLVGCSSKLGKSLKNNRLDETPLNVIFVNDFNERMKQRQNRLENFLMMCDDEDAYKNFVKTLISFEEGLIEN